MPRFWQGVCRCVASFIIMMLMGIQRFSTAGVRPKLIGKPVLAQPARLVRVSAPSSQVTI
jgi:hypothetical protein